MALGVDGGRLGTVVFFYLHRSFGSVPNAWCKEAFVNRKLWIGLLLAGICAPRTNSSLAQICVATWRLLLFSGVLAPLSASLKSRGCQ